MLDVQNINEIISTIANKHNTLDIETINSCIRKLTLYICNTNLETDEQDLLKNIVAIIQHI